MRLFLSHSSKDKPTVYKIIDILDQYGIPYWLDECEIEFGQSISEKINEGLSLCNILLLFISKHSTNSRWSQREWHSILHRALSTGDKTVIAIRLDDSEVPLIISDMLYIDLRNDFRSVVRYIASLKSKSIDLFNNNTFNTDFLNLIFDSCNSVEITGDYSVAVKILIDSIDLKKYTCPRDLVGRWKSELGWCNGLILSITEKPHSCYGWSTYGECMGSFGGNARQGIIQMMWEVGRGLFVFNWVQEVGAEMSEACDHGKGILWRLPARGVDRLRGLWFYETRMTRASFPEKLYRWSLRRVPTSQKSQILTQKPPRQNS